MYNEVLKYGSYIVDALVKYEQPVFVYIPPHGELRGGSWVVVDPTINPQQMEMYADEDARGGVLEPEGIVGIKYRRERQLETMARLDPVYGELKAKSNQQGLSKEEAQAIKAKMTEREQLLLPVYAQVSVQFADLHDRAGRMVAKGVIRRGLRWQNARRFFYWRLRRRLNEDYTLKKMAAAGGLVSDNANGPSTQQPMSVASRDTKLALLRAWSNIERYDEDDMSVAVWCEENRKQIGAKIDALKRESVATDVATLLRRDREAGLKGVAQVLAMLPVEEREELLKTLSRS